MGVPWNVFHPQEVSILKPNTSIPQKRQATTENTFAFAGYLRSSQTALFKGTTRTPAGLVALDERLCTRLPRRPIRIQQAGKTLLSRLIQCNKKSIEVRQLFSLETASNVQEKAFTIPKTVCKKRKWWNILSFQALIWRQRQATRSQFARWVSPGRIIVLLFWTKYVVPSQINSEFSS